MEIENAASQSNYNHRLRLRMAAKQVAKRFLDKVLNGQRRALVTGPSAVNGVGINGLQQVSVTARLLTTPSAVVSGSIKANSMPTFTAAVALQSPFRYSTTRLVSTSRYKLTDKSRSASSPELRDTPSIPVISHDDVRRHIEAKDAILVDCRTTFEAEEYGQIPGSYTISHDEFGPAMKLTDEEFKVKYGFPKFDPNGPPLIIYCRSGRRADEAGRLLRDFFGFSNDKLLNYKNSWIEWEKKHPEHVKKIMPSKEEIVKMVMEKMALAKKK